MLHYNQRLWCFFEPEASWSDLPFGWSWLSTALYSVDTFSLSLPLVSLPLYSAIAFSLHFEGEKLIKVAATENNLFKSHFSRENCDHDVCYEIGFRSVLKCYISLLLTTLVILSLEHLLLGLFVYEKNFT